MFNEFAPDLGLAWVAGGGGGCIGGRSAGRRADVEVENMFHRLPWWGSPT